MTLERQGPKRFSIRRRLLLSLLVATALFGTLALWDTRAEAVRMANLLADRVLAGSALVIAERASLDHNGRLSIDIPYGALEMLSSPAQDRVFYRVEGPDDHVVTGYADLPAVGAEIGGPTVFADAMYRGVPIRIASLARTVATGIDEVPFVVSVAETTTARKDLTRQILARSALRLLLMMAGAGLVVLVAVSLSLRPLQRLSLAIAERSPQDLSAVGEQVPSEVAGLVDAINSFMARLDSALQGLRHFTGNAAHQLRTPLTVVRMQLALAGRARDLAQAQQAVDKGDQALAHAEGVLAQLLLLAKVDASRDPVLETVDLVDLARAATAEMVPMAAGAGIDLGFEALAPQLAIRADPLLLAEALNNLLRNALIHTPRGTEVTVRLYQGDAQAVVLEVEDDGLGLDPAARTRLLTRFGRGATGAEGMGLGLAVVDEIVKLFGGTFSLHEGARGRGLRAELRFACA